MGIKKILIILGIILLIVIIITIVLITTGNNKYKRHSKEVQKIIKMDRNYGELLKVRYSNNGNSNGNIDEIEIDIKNKTLKTSYKEYHSDPLEEKTYKITDKDIEKIQEYINEYNLPMWKDLPEDTDLIALDASVSNLTFIYDNSKLGGNKYATYTIGDTTILNNEDAKVYREFYDYLFSLKK